MTPICLIFKSGLSCNVGSSLIQEEKISTDIENNLFVVYLVALRSQLRPRRRPPRSPAGRRSGTRSPTAAAGRCCGRADSDRDAPRPGTGPWPSAGGASSSLHTAPPSPARAEDAAGKTVDSLFILSVVEDGGERNIQYSEQKLILNLETPWPKWNVLNLWVLPSFFLLIIDI